MNCDKCGTEFEATGTTPEYPDCNTWTCPKCGYVRPELGSLRLADALPTEPPTLSVLASRDSPFISALPTDVTVPARGQ